MLSLYILLWRHRVPFRVYRWFFRATVRSTSHYVVTSSWPAFFWQLLFIAVRWRWSRGRQVVRRLVADRWRHSRATPSVFRGPDDRLMTSPGVVAAAMADASRRAGTPWRQRRYRTAATRHLVTSTVRWRSPGSRWSSSFTSSTSSSAGSVLTVVGSRTRGVESSTLEPPTTWWRHCGIHFQSCAGQPCPITTSGRRYRRSVRRRRYIVTSRLSSELLRAVIRRCITTRSRTFSTARRRSSTSRRFRSRGCGSRASSRSGRRRRDETSRDSATRSTAPTQRATSTSTSGRRSAWSPLPAAAILRGHVTWRSITRMYGRGTRAWRRTGWRRCWLCRGRCDSSFTGARQRSTIQSTKYSTVTWPTATWRHHHVTTWAWRHWKTAISAAAILAVAIASMLATLDRWWIPTVFLRRATRRQYWWTLGHSAVINLTDIILRGKLGISAALVWDAPSHVC